MNDAPEERQEDPVNPNVGLISDTESSSLRVADQRDPNEEESAGHEPPESENDPLRPPEQFATNQGDVNPLAFANYPQPYMPFSAFNNGSQQHAPGMFPQAQGPQPPHPGAFSFSPESSMMIPPSVAPPYQEGAPPSSPQHALATMQFYEARMRDHAAAYATAAASAAWAAALFAMGASPPPPPEVLANWNQQQQQSGNHWGIPPDSVGDGSFGAASNWDVQERNQNTQTQQPLPILPPRNPDADDDKSEASDEDVDVSRQHRRKRQQRLPPDDSSIPRVIAPPRPQQQQQQQQQQRGKVRRRMRSDGDSSSSGSSFYHSSHRSSGGRGDYRRNYNQKKKARSDETLLGKTAVAALYEWCSRRSHMPSFVLQETNHGEFDCTVYLEEDMEWGRGRGRNKGAAKQDAARRALQALYPGIEFDETSGFVVQVPRETRRDDAEAWKANRNHLLEDLAPNLEKQLAIGSESHPAKPAHHQTKRFLETYPGTSTTSEEEDANAYYSTRGASILSNLLFLTVQIDPRTPYAPTFLYQVSPVQSSAYQSAQLKRKTSSSGSTRGRFTCTAELEIHEHVGGDKNQVFQIGQDVGDPSSLSAEDKRRIRILKADGIGASKREARHAACAHLLALLFPQCKTMVEVKMAAEAAQAQYSANKALKSNQGSVFDDDSVSDCSPVHAAYAFALAEEGDPSLPAALQRGLENLLYNSSLDPNDDERRNNDEDKKPAALGGSLTLGRKKQLDTMVDEALLNLNERDEEGRCLPEELTADDVGRTVLRRAEPDDMTWIRKLFSGNLERPFQDSPLASVAKKESPRNRMRSLSLAEEDSNDISSSDDEGMLVHLWSPSSIVLLLCRAIAAYEDPPLGCAVLNVDFCMERGRLLRVATIATEPHLPRERFVEVLEDFASSMQCSLETTSHSMNDPSALRLSVSDTKHIVESYLGNSKGSHTAKSMSCSEADRVEGVKPPLQSVQEESEVSDSSAEKRPARRQSKPSKRSRFQ